LMWTGESWIGAGAAAALVDVVTVVPVDEVEVELDAGVDCAAGAVLTVLVVDEVGADVEDVDDGAIGCDAEVEVEEPAAVELVDEAFTAAVEELPAEAPPEAGGAVLGNEPLGPFESSEEPDRSPPKAGKLGAAAGAGAGLAESSVSEAAAVYITNGLSSGRSSSSSAEELAGRGDGELVDVQSEF
jgi:hypothetical protein